MYCYVLDKISRAMLSAAIIQEAHQSTAKDYGCQGSWDVWAWYRADCVCVLQPRLTWAVRGDILSSLSAEFSSVTVDKPGEFQQRPCNALPKSSVFGDFAPPSKDDWQGYRGGGV